MSGNWAVEAAGLRKSYGKIDVLAGIDLKVPAASVFSLLGPNGAGKTTTVRILSTLLRADGGQARVGGFDVDRQQRDVRRIISLTGQSASVDQLQTGEENLRMTASLAGVSRRDAKRRAQELLERFDLAEAGNRRVATYSGGMRRRLDLAAGLVGRPSVIFLDEPTTGLDPRSRRSMWDVITGLLGEGVTIFLTTQYLEEADQLADSVAVLDGGRVVAEGAPAELKRRVAGQRLDLVFGDDAGYDEGLRLLPGRISTEDRARLTIGVPTDGSAAQVRSLLDEIDPQARLVSSFSVHTATLDDVFLALTGRPAQSGQNENSNETDKETAGV
ncbi:ATP-binding cassette domain-containing protein [Streptomyces sp. NPDC048491]|uniref:ATP-binding cassette domain-containing protein n=1 Tax=Streptomyces TaxID=1883 RepID=UPI000C280A13|nr:ATP-binding cassette domain-containing protein [Streptomyces sp. CB01201]MBX7469289.1 ATP-binding cassette domain-containing protein [Streptomyces sp. MAG02]PJN02572.1 ABC transporter [Streptomyces sp. CB01201]